MRTSTLLSVCSLVTSVALCSCGSPAEVANDPSGLPSVAAESNEKESADPPVSMAQAKVESGPLRIQLPDGATDILPHRGIALPPKLPQGKTTTIASHSDSLLAAETLTPIPSPLPIPVPRPPIEVKTPQERAIDAKYNLLGGAAGFLGSVLEGLTPTPDGIGSFKRYAGGSIYYTSSTGAQQIGGAIRDKWAALGWERSFLGYPLTDELGTPDRIGRYNHFQSGSIYWTPGTGAHEVHGDIRARWAGMGWETSLLGYPLTDETTAPDGFGKYNHFQGGSIYWTSTTGAKEIYGPIRNKWASMGWERSFLGYPVTGVTSVPGVPGPVSFFERGAIIQSGASSAFVVPSSREFVASSITFPDGVPVGGNSKLTIRADGSYTFEGHFHVSGAGCWDESLLWVVRTESGRVFTFTHEGKLSGTFCSGSRDDDWIVTGTNDALGASFGELKTDGAVVRSTTGFNLGGMWAEIKKSIGYVKDVIEVAGPIFAAL